jgi:hypothetical protein
MFQFKQTISNFLRVQNLNGRRNNMINVDFNSPKTLFLSCFIYFMRRISNYAEYPELLSATNFSPEHRPQINVITASRAGSQSEALFTRTF